MKYTADNIIDAEKSYMLDGDDSLCWAAVCSNMLTYTGISVHEGTDHVHQEDATMDYYAARYEDAYATIYGLMDYIEDNNINTDNIDLGYVKFSNGKTNLDEISGLLKDDYVVSFYMLGTSFVGHGVTCWGITKNEDGYTGVVITDSDDEETEDPKTAPN